MTNASPFDQLVRDLAAVWQDKGLTITTGCEDDAGQKPAPFVRLVETIIRSAPRKLQQHLEALPEQGPRDWRPLSAAVAQALES